MHTYIQTDRQIHRHTDTQTHRHTYTHTHAHTCICIYIYRDLRYIVPLYNEDEQGFEYIWTSYTLLDYTCVITCGYGEFAIWIHPYHPFVSFPFILIQFARLVFFRAFLRRDCPNWLSWLERREPKMWSNWRLLYQNASWMMLNSNFGTLETIHVLWLAFRLKFRPWNVNDIYGWKGVEKAHNNCDTSNLRLSSDLWLKPIKHQGSPLPCTLSSNDIETFLHTFGLGDCLASHLSGSAESRKPKGRPLLGF